MQRQVAGAHHALHQQRRHAQAAVIVQLAGRRAAAAGQAQRQLQRRRFRARGQRREIPGLERDGAGLPLHRAHRQRIAVAHLSALDRQASQLHLPGTLHWRGASRGCRTRRPLPALEHPAALGIALHADHGLVQRQLAYAQLLRGQAQLGVFEQQLAHARRRGRVLQRQIIQRQARDLDRQRVARPAQAQLRRRPPLHQGLELGRQIRSAQAQRHGLQAHRHAALAGRGLAFEIQQAGRGAGLGTRPVQAQAALELHGLGQRQRDRARLQADVGQYQVCALGAGLGRLIAPLGTALLHDDLLDLDLPGHGLRRRRVARLALPCQGQPVELATRIAPCLHLGRGQHHGFQPHLPAQRLHLAQRHAQTLECQQFLALGIAQPRLVQRELPAHAHLGLFGLLKADFNIRVQPTCGNLQRHRARDIAQEVGQVQALECQPQLGGAALQERRAQRRGVKGAAVELECKPRRDAHLLRRGQCAEERQIEHQTAHLVCTLDQRIVEIHRAAAHADVVERKALQLGLLVGRRGRGQALQDVIHVIVTGAGLGQMQHGRIDLDGIEHRRQAQQRLQLRINIYTLHRKQWLRSTRQAIDAQAMEKQLQRPWPELHRGQRHVAAQLFRGQALNLAFEQRGHGQPQRQP